jgi:hypothetical protein
VLAEWRLHSLSPVGCDDASWWWWLRGVKTISGVGQNWSRFHTSLASTSPILHETFQVNGKEIINAFSVQIDELPREEWCKYWTMRLKYQTGDYI